MWETLEGMVREKAQEFIQQIMEEEVTELLGREKSERRSTVDSAEGYRNGYGKLEARTVEAMNRRAVRLIKTAARPTHTITADNGTEFHGYGAIEAETGSKFYFAAPYHSWERGTSENTNGLIRQYLPKRTSMAHITQHACNRIAHKLNNRPRKRLGFLTPKDCYELNSTT